MTATRIDEDGTVTTLRAINGYSFTLDCPDCPDGGMVHIADGTSTGWDARAIAKCSACLRSWVVSVQLGVAGRMTK